MTPEGKIFQEMVAEIEDLQRQNQRLKNPLWRTMFVIAWTIALALSLLGNIYQYLTIRSMNEEAQRTSQMSVTYTGKDLGSLEMTIRDLRLAEREASGLANHYRAIVRMQIQDYDRELSDIEHAKKALVERRQYEFIEHEAAKAQKREKDAALLLKVLNATDEQIGSLDRQKRKLAERLGVLRAQPGTIPTAEN